MEREWTWRAWLVFGVIVLGLSLFIGWLATDLREKQSEALACGSVGRLVATAEAIAEAEEDGSVTLRIGFAGEEKTPTTTLSVWWYVPTPDADAPGIYQQDWFDYTYVEGVTPCQMLAELAHSRNVTVDDLEYSTARAREIERIYADRSKAARNFRVWTEYTLAEEFENILQGWTEY